MRFLYWCTAGSLMVLSVDFAVSNQGSLELTLWPFQSSVTVKVYALAFGIFAISFFAGGFVAWLDAGKTRSRVRAAERKVREEEREIVDLKRKLDKAEATSVETPESRLLIPADNN